MDKKVGTAIALLAAFIAIAIVLAGGPLVAAIGVAVGGGLLGSLARHLGGRNESVGIR